jgi:tRNA1Val (adenine37-N6)-methyltransferase
MISRWLFSREEMSEDFEWTKFLRGRIEILQPKKGARFSIDSVILSGFSFVRDGESVLDLGCGTGIILAIINEFYHPTTLYGVELQEKLAHCSYETMKRLKEGDWEIINCDLKEYQSEKKFDLVVFNPPFFDLKSGLISPDEERRLSRQGENTTLKDFLKCAFRNLKEEGRICFIFPKEKEKEAMKSLKENNFHPAILRNVRDSIDSDFQRILILVRKKESFFVELPPLTLRDENKDYSEEMKRLLGEIPFRDEPSFFCDAMALRLAKYLRFSGFDTAYLKGADDDWLLKECEKSGRTLLSLDRELIKRFKKRGVKVFELDSFSPREQFKKVLSHFKLKEREKKRCLNCNAEVFKIEKDRVQKYVPEYTFMTQKDFYICPSCSKITWGGSHLSRFRNEILKG